MILRLENGDEYRSIPMKLADDIAEKIHSSYYVDKLPPVRTLASEYQVSVKTANRAVALLVSKGMLESRPGRGTSISLRGRDIATKMKKSEHSEKLVMFFIPSSSGHFFGDLYAHTTSLLNDSEYFPMVISSGEQEAMLARALRELRPAAIVINRGWWEFPYDKLSEAAARGIRIIFQMRSEYEHPLQADYVLSDTTYGGYIATKHLIKQGHRNILHLTFRHSPTPPPMSYRYTEQYHMIQGYRMALDEAGLSENEMISYETGDEVENSREFRRIMSDPQRPTAVFAESDYRILNHYETIKELGLSVPGDLALVGYFNTPHCRFCEVPMTSVSINVEELAKRTVECVTSENSLPQRFSIKPELVVRKSSVVER